MRFVGFILGFAAVAGLEYMLLWAMNLAPRGPAWLVLPIVAGVSLGRAAPSIAARISSGSAEQAFLQLAPATRIAAIGIALWLIAVPTYVFLFEPYGSYMASYDYAHMLKVMLFPAVLSVLGSWAYRRFGGAHNPVAPSSTRTENSMDRIDEGSDIEPQAAQWYFMTGGEQRGPVSLRQLKELISNGDVGPEAKIFGPGTIVWRKVKNTRLSRGGRP